MKILFIIFVLLGASFPEAKSENDNQCKEPCAEDECCVYLDLSKPVCRRYLFLRDLCISNYTDKGPYFVSCPCFRPYTCYPVPVVDGENRQGYACGLSADYYDT